MTKIHLSQLLDCILAQVQSSNFWSIIIELSVLSRAIIDYDVLLLMLSHNDSYKVSNPPPPSWQQLSSPTVEQHYLVSVMVGVVMVCSGGGGIMVGGGQVIH